MNEPKTILEPIGGYLLDVLAKLRNVPFNPHSLTKLHTLRMARERTGATSVIEIGSFKGVTTRRLSYIFDNVYSVEIDPQLFAEAKVRCGDRKNVTLMLGDGKKLLGGLGAQVRKCIAFLDGHFSGEGTGQGEEAEPALHELDVIAPHLDNFVAVVVDDFREFGRARGWPAKSAVMAKLESCLPEAEWEHWVMYDQFVTMRRGPH